MGVDYEQEPSEWLKAYLPRSALGWCLDKEVRTIDKSERFLGINWAAFASDLKKCGGFNPAFGPGSPTGSTGQETNMQKRLVGGVRGIYTPNALVWHFVLKERCSSQWVLMRAYRNGVERGLESQPEAVKCFGYPRAMCRQWLNKGWRAIRDTLASDPQVCFDAYYLFICYSGFIKGNRIVSQGSSANHGGNVTM